jgi:hypothetical protein
MRVNHDRLELRRNFFSGESDIDSWNRITVDIKSEQKIAMGDYTTVHK